MLANEILAEIYRHLSQTSDLTDIVGDGIFTQPQSPRKSYPVLLISVRSTAETAHGAGVHDTFIEFVARSNYGDGMGTELDRIFNVVDREVNGERFVSDNASCTRLSRRNISVQSGIKDVWTGDWVKRWMYRTHIKSIN